MYSDLETMVGKYLETLSRRHGVQLIHPNTGDKPNNDLQPVLYLDWLPVDPRPVTVSGGAQYVTILQLRVAVPVGSGTVAKNKLIDAVTNWLPPVKDFVSSSGRRFRTLERAAPLPPYLDGGWLITPAQCRISTIR